MGNRPAVVNGIGGGHKSQGRNNNLVSRLHTGQLQSHVKSCRAADDGDRFSGTGEIRQHGFEPVHIFPDVGHIG